MFESLIFNLAVVPADGSYKKVLKALQKGKIKILNSDYSYLYNLNDPDKFENRILLTVIGSSANFIKLRKEALGNGWSENVCDGVYSLVQ